MIWPCYKLFKITSDIQPGFARLPKESDDNYPHLRTNNVSSDGRIDLSYVKSVSVKKHEIERYSLKYGDILFNNTNSSELVGKTAFFDVHDGEFLFSNHMTRIRVDPQIVHPKYIAKYIFWFWKIGGFKRLITRWVNQAAINKTMLGNIEIPLPPLSEQRRIVEILDQADALRKKRTEADAKAARILPALFYEMFGDPISFLSHSESIDLSNFNIDIQNGFACGQKDVLDGHPHLRMNNIDDLGVLNLDLLRTVPLEKKSDRYRLEKGDVLFMGTNSEDKIGKSCVFYPPDKRCFLFSNHLIRLRIFDIRLSPEYLSSYLHLLWEKKYFLSIAKRWVNQSTISQESLKRVRICVPDKSKLMSYTKSYKDLLSLGNIRCSSLDNSNKIFSCLLHHAFTGNLTSQWREAHIKELLAEMEEQTKALGIL